MTDAVTLADLDTRYQNILKEFPDIERCSFGKCNNPVDGDTTCAYHRLLFDHWMYEIKGRGIMQMSSMGRRIAFSRWVNKTGKDVCDAIVLDMAQYDINWVC